ncbi:MAG: FG-GAP-like repeat-containing protein [Saprospiraceae bacterium]
MYLNDGTGTFSDVTETHLPFDNDHTLDGIFTDVDDDRDLDLVIGNFAGAPIRVYRNDGTGRFSNQTTEVLGQLYYRDALGIIAADLNGDQALDLYICDRHNPNIGNKDLFFLKIRNSTATKDLYAASSLFQLFPNPTEKRFTIALQSATINPQALHFQLLDANGKSVAALKPSAADQKQIQFQLDQRLSTGTYFVQITDKETAQLHYVKLVIT